MKVRELKKVPSDKIGRVYKNNVRTELHEDGTALCLTQFGFNIEFLRPRNTNKAKSADLFMMGAAWEMKCPTSFKPTTIRSDFRKASLQSDRVIFDLRRLVKNADLVEKILIKIFNGRGRVRKLIIIRKDETVVEFSK